MKLLPIQTSFSAGKLSEKMLARTDTDGYREAFKDGKNFLVYPQGPADMRFGTEFKYRLAGSSRVGRIFPFIYTKDEAYVIVVTKDEIRVMSLDITTNDALVSPYSTDEQVSQLHIGEPPGEDRVTLTTGLVSPRFIDYGSPFTIGAVAFTNAPSDWTGTVWPKTVGFGNGRAWYANIEGDVERYWASKSGAFYNFDTGTSADDDAIDRTIDKKGGINWIVNAKEITFGTDRGVFLVTSSGGVITPSDIQVDKESSKGTNSIQGFDVGQSVIYVSPDGRKLREFKYSFNTGGYVAEDLTFLTDDITLNNTIQGIAYEEDPDSHIWMPTENGSVLGCTYDFTTKRLGWHPHDYFGDIIDICSVKQNGTNQTWMLVDNGSGLDVVKVGTEYLDHYSTQEITSGVATSSIGPFAQLANEEVHVLTNGANDNKITLDSSGNGTTNTPGLEFVVGKSYEEAYIDSLNLDRGAPTGSGASLQKRWNKLFVHISESAKPLIDGKRPPTRSPSTPMGQVEELRTEYVQVTTRGWSREGTVRISQDLPFKTTILAFLGQMEQA